MRPQDPSSSAPTSPTPPDEAKLALGIKLLSQLEKGQERDFLSRWMCHYIAGLIVAAESSPPESAPAAKEECFEAILQLWKRRSAFPTGARPFGETEKFFEVIRDLDPDHPFPRHFRFLRSQIQDDDEGVEVRSSIELIRRIDQGARILIGYMLSEAAAATMHPEREWVELAKSAGVEVEMEDTLVRFIVNISHSEEEIDDALSRLRRKQIIRRKATLDDFIELSRQLSEKLAAEIGELPMP